MDDRTRQLIEHRRRLLQQAPRQRLETILSASRPAELVRSLPAQDFFLTVVENGIDRSLELLPLASRHQLDFILDVDGWTGDQLDPQRVAGWLEAFGKAGPGLAERWLSEADEPTVVLALSRLLRVYKLDESTSEDFWPPDDRELPTLDGVYFLEGRENVPEGALAALWRGLLLLRERRPSAYEALLEQVLWIVPAEQEEESWSRRWSRLAERGFPDPDEALGVWSAGDASSPSARESLARRLVESAASDGTSPLVGLEETVETASDGASTGAGEQEPAVGVPVRGSSAAGGPRIASLPAPLLAGDSPIARCLARLGHEERARVLHDLVRLGNRFAVAGGGDLGDPRTHGAGLDAATSHVQLGLDEIAGDAGTARASRVVACAPLAEIVRLGVGAVEQRAARARSLASGWLSRVHLARQRLDGELDDLLSGLLLARPRFAEGGSERWFRSAEDLRAVDAALSAIESFGTFLETVLAAAADELPELVPLPAGRDAPGDIEWSAVALTAAARQILGHAPRPRPLARHELVRALELLLEPDGGPASDGFRAALASLRLEPAETYLTKTLEADLQHVDDARGVDPRYARALLLAR